MLVCTSASTLIPSTSRQNLYVLSQGPFTCYIFNHPQTSLSMAFKQAKKMVSCTRRNLKGNSDTFALLFTLKVFNTTGMSKMVACWWALFKTLKPSFQNRRNHLLPILLPPHPLSSPPYCWWPTVSLNPGPLSKSPLLYLPPFTDQLPQTLVTS